MPLAAQDGFWTSSSTMNSWALTHLTISPKFRCCRLPSWHIGHALNICTGWYSWVSWPDVFYHHEHYSLVHLECSLLTCLEQRPSSPLILLLWFGQTSCIPFAVQGRHLQALPGRLSSDVFSFSGYGGILQFSSGYFEGVLSGTTCHHSGFFIIMHPISYRRILLAL